MPVTLRFQSTGAVPGHAQPVSMRGGSLTVGRAPDNDLVLPDPDKIISKRHCAIERHNSSIVVVDLSANGTFLNYDKVPLGRTPTRLHDGDILTLGAYELLVEVNEDVPEHEPMPPSPGPERRGTGDHEDPLDVSDGDGDFLDELLGDTRPNGPKSVQRPELGEDGLMPPLGEDEDLLGPAEEEPTAGSSQADHGDAAHDFFRPGQAGDFIPDDWDAALPPQEPGAAGRESGATVPEDFDAPHPPGGTETPEEAAREPRPGHAPQHPAGQVPSDAARAFLDALGQGRLDVPDEELEETMERLGHVMRTMIEGLREILMTRAAIKSEFRIQSTIIGASGNNPLKFSASPEQAVEAMVRSELPGYLRATDAARQALDDIKAHEVATVTGMEAALQGILDRLAPGALEGQIRSKGGLADMLKGRKALYWEAYERLFAQISDQAEKEFHDVFGREFARAYQAQLEKLKE